MRRRWMASHENLRHALFFVETVIILDNSSAIEPLQPLAYIDKGEFTFRAASMPAHIASLLPSAQELIDAHRKKPETNPGTGGDPILK